MMNAECADNFSFRPAKIEQGVYRILAILIGVAECAHSFWQCIVLSAGHHLKVVRVVVQSVAVDMVNDFIRQQIAPKRFGGNNAMFQQIRATFTANNFVAVTRYVSTFPIGVIGAVLIAGTFSFTTPHGAITKLPKAGGAKSWMSEHAIFLGRHLMGNAQVRGGYLHRAGQSAQRTVNGIFWHSRLHSRVIKWLPSAAIIPHRCMDYNVRV
jgi:hypothetical protein